MEYTEEKRNEWGTDTTNKHSLDYSYGSYTQCVFRFLYEDIVMKSGYIIIKVEHEAENLEIICKECEWDIDHELLLDGKIIGYVEHNPEFDYEVLH